MHSATQTQLEQSSAVFKACTISIVLPAPVYLQMVQAAVGVEKSSPVSAAAADLTVPAQREGKHSRSSGQHFPPQQPFPVTAWRKSTGQVCVMCCRLGKAALSHQ